MIKSFHTIVTYTHTAGIVVRHDLKPVCYHCKMLYTLIAHYLGL